MIVWSSRKVMSFHSVLLWRRPREACLPFSVPVPCTTTFCTQRAVICFQTDWRLSAIMEEMYEFLIIHTVPGPARPVQKRSFLCWETGQVSVLPSFPYVSGEASPACEWGCNETCSRANRSFCPSIPALHHTTQSLR